MTPELFALIHDTSNPTKRIRQLVEMLRGGTQTPKAKITILDFIVQSTKDLDAAVDTFYLSQKVSSSTTQDAKDRDDLKAGVPILTRSQQY